VIKGKLPPETINKHLTAAIMAVMKELHQVQIGVKVTDISVERSELSPSGIGYRIALNVAISGNPEPVVLDEKKEASV